MEKAFYTKANKFIHKVLGLQSLNKQAIALLTWLSKFGLLLTEDGNTIKNKKDFYGFATNLVLETKKTAKLAL